MGTESVKNMNFYCTPAELPVVPGPCHLLSCGRLRWMESAHRFAVGHCADGYLSMLLGELMPM